VDLFDKPKRFHRFFDYDEAVAAAIQAHNPEMSERIASNCKPFDNSTSCLFSPLC